MKLLVAKCNSETPSEPTIIVAVGSQMTLFHVPKTMIMAHSLDSAKGTIANDLSDEIAVCNAPIRPIHLSSIVPLNLIMMGTSSFLLFHKVPSSSSSDGTRRGNFSISVSGRKILLGSLGNSYVKSSTFTN